MGHVLVSAANNVVGASYPSLFAAVVSVAAHDAGDPDVWFYNPAPPVEFGAHGLDVDVAWRGAHPGPLPGRVIALVPLPTVLITVLMLHTVARGAQLAQRALDDRPVG